MVSDADALARLLQLLDDARTFAELDESLKREQGAPTDLFARALRFVAEGDPSCLDAPLQERFAQVLSRFVESRRALKLAGILEAGAGAEEEDSKRSPAP
jgi:hypothetical protein